MRRYDLKFLDDSTAGGRGKMIDAAGVVVGSYVLEFDEGHAPPPPGLLILAMKAKLAVVDNGVFLASELTDFSTGKRLLTYRSTGPDFGEVSFDLDAIVAQALNPAASPVQAPRPTWRQLPSLLH